MTAPISSYFDDGMRFFEEGHYEQAIELFTKALRLSLGDLAQTHLYRGISYAYLDAFDKALNDFNNALRKNPYIADAYNERGNLYRLSDDYQLALDDYDAAIAIDKAHYAAYYNRALTHEKMGQLTAADSDLSHAIGLQADIPAFYEARGRIRVEIKNYDGAIADYEQFLALGGGHEYDNESDVQSLMIALRINHFLSRFIPTRFLPNTRL
ncbi:MAG: tetratricopeptide repeat protein [Phototrophicaceae bacterium]